VSYLPLSPPSAQANLTLSLINSDVLSVLSLTPLMRIKKNIFVKNKKINCLSLNIWAP
jgi:hypothetical protein